MGKLLLTSAIAFLVGSLSFAQAQKDPCKEDGFKETDVSLCSTLDPDLSNGIQPKNVAEGRVQPPGAKNCPTCKNASANQLTDKTAFTPNAAGGKPEAGTPGKKPTGAR